MINTHSNSVQKTWCSVLSTRTEVWYQPDWPFMLSEEKRSVMDMISYKSTKYNWDKMLDAHTCYADF